MSSGFQKAPGTPERREADRNWIELHKTASVKNPRRYNVDTNHAFGIVKQHAGAWMVDWRGVAGGEMYPTLDAMLDDGWTVD